MEIDKKLFILCISLIFVLSATLSVQYIANRRSDQYIREFITRVNDSESDADVLKFTEEFINSYQSAFSLSESGAARRFSVSGRDVTPKTSARPSPSGPTKQAPIVYEPQTCSSDTRPCIALVSPDTISMDEVGKAFITISGDGFERDRTLVYLCNAKLANCNTVIPSTPVNYESDKKREIPGLTIVNEKILNFIVPDTLEISCRQQDEACLAGFIKGYPVVSGDYYIEVQTRNGTSNKLPFTITK